MLVSPSTRSKYTNTTWLVFQSIREEKYDHFHCLYISTPIIHVNVFFSFVHRDACLTKKQAYLESSGGAQNHQIAAANCAPLTLHYAEEARAAASSHTTATAGNPGLLHSTVLLICEPEGFHKRELQQKEI